MHPSSTSARPTGRHLLGRTLGTASLRGRQAVRLFAAGVLAACMALPAHAALLSINEGFDNTASLGGSGWSLQNLSTPVGSTNWFQGDPSTFGSHDGAANAYIAADYKNTGGDGETSTGTINNWLITPELAFSAGATLTFWTRTIGGASEGGPPAEPQFALAAAAAAASEYPDRLEVRLSTAGASTAVGDFSTLKLSINPDLTQVDYPTEWTKYTVTGLPSNGSGRIAFRYAVTDAGPGGSNSNYIGIDRVQYGLETTAAVPVPVGGPWSLALLSLALAGLVGWPKRKA